jgi:hypothetical protein
LVSQGVDTVRGSFPPTGGKQVHPFDERLVALERRQYGLASLAQVSNGWTRGLVRRRLHERRERVAPRVFANRSVATSYEQRVLAGVMCAGAGAVASHETAARLHGLPLPGPATLEVTTSERRRPIVAGVRMHRTRCVDASDVGAIRGIPVTRPALTIYSLSARFSIRILGRMTDDALQRRILTLDELFEVVERLRPANGRSRAKMRVVLARRDPDVATRESPLEDFVAAALVRFGLPRPVAQHRVTHGGQERRIDQCYVDAKLALEAKGFSWYARRTEWDRDALRGNELLLAGYRVLTFTSAFTDHEIATQVATALGIPPPRWMRPRTFTEWTRTR